MLAETIESIKRRQEEMCREIVGIGIFTPGAYDAEKDLVAQFGIKPGTFAFVFTPGEDNSQGTFVCSIGGLPLNGTYTVGQAEKTVTLQFGKVMKFLSMTGTLNSTLTGAEMVFHANKMLAFLKKVASVAGNYSSTIGTITSLADGYDNLKLGFKLAKQ